MNGKFSIFFFTLTICSSLILGGCFGPGTSEPRTSASQNEKQPSSELKAFENNEFFVAFPSNWNVIQRNKFTSDVPDETQLVIRNNIKNEIFTATVSIVKNKVDEGINSIDYAQSLLNGQRESLIGFKEIEIKRVTIPMAGKDTETLLILFEAKLNPSEPTLRFIQTVGIKNQIAYIILGATTLQEQQSVIDSVSNSVKSFRIK